MAARYMVVTSGDVAWDGPIWSATATGAAGSAATPVNGDDVYIVQGTANITSSLAQSGVTLNSLTIGYGGVIGTSATSLAINIGNADSAYFYGSGTYNLTVTDGGLYTGTFNVLDTFSGTINFTNAGAGNLICGQTGIVNLYGCQIDTVKTCGCSLYGDGDAQIVALKTAAGNHKLNRGISGSLDISGRNTSVTISGINAGSGAITVYGGAYIHESAGTITTIVVYPNAKASAVDGYGPFTVTNSELWAGGSLFTAQGNLITYTNATVKVGFR